MLTAKGVLALPAGEDGVRADYWDQKVRGLVLRVTAQARAYSVSLADARDRALEIRRQARGGDGMKRGEAPAPRTLDEYRRTLKADVLPAIAGIPPGQFTRAQIRSLVDSIRGEGHPVHANRVTRGAEERLLLVTAQPARVPR